MNEDVKKIELNLVLSVHEINIILSVLGKHPFDEVASLITKIKLQGESQLKDIVDKSPVE